MPYDPAANPYTLNPRELPSNPAAAARVPRWNTIDPATGVAYVAPANWAASPSTTPNWGSMLVPPNVTTTPVPSLTSPCASTGTTWPDALVADRQATKIPTVIGVSPGTAVHAVATPVTITGYGFTGATAVTINGVACTAVTVVNDATITATTGATTVAGTGVVAVTTPAGVGSGTSFTFT
jgi:hypothetical protein